MSIRGMNILLERRWRSGSSYVEAMLTVGGFRWRWEGMEWGREYPYTVTVDSGKLTLWDSLGRYAATWWQA